MPVQYSWPLLKKKKKGGFCRQSGISCAPMSPSPAGSNDVLDRNAGTSVERIVLRFTPMQDALSISSPFFALKSAGLHPSDRSHTKPSEDVSLRQSLSWHPKNEKVSCKYNNNKARRTHVKPIDDQPRSVEYEHSSNNPIQECHDSRDSIT